MAFTKVRVRTAACFISVACIGAASCASGAGPTSVHGAPAGLSSLSIGLTQEPDTLNPMLAQTAAAQEVDSAIFDGLLQVDAHDKLQSDLALTWAHSADWKTWTFHLRRGVHWADGKTFTSADVASTYQTMSSPTSPVAVPPGWNLVDRLSTPDPDTVIIHVRMVSAPWLLQLGTTAILPQHLQAGRSKAALAAFSRKPLGTGPYRVLDWTPGQDIMLTANPRSWHGTPHYARLTFRLYAGDAQLLAALHSGAIQVAPINPGQVSYARRVGLHVVEGPGMTWYHVDLKQSGPLRDQAVRQALDYAVPRAEILRTVAFGHGQLAFADIAPALAPYFDPTLRPRPYLPSRARSLLATAGYRPDPHGVLRRCSTAKQKPPCPALDITLWNIQGDSFGFKINQILARAWGAIGLRVARRQETAGTLFGAGGPQFTHDTTGITYAWTNGDDPDDRFYWNSSSIPPYPSATGGNDVAYFHRFAFQSTIDRLTKLGADTTNQPERRQVYRDIQALLLAQAPDIFLYWQNQLWVAPASMHGFVPNPFTPLLWNVVAWS